MSEKRIPPPAPGRTTISLARAWTYAESRRIGAPGGFGHVFAGEAADGSPVAIKRIWGDTPGLATGEIKVARSLMTRHPRHVIPILDAGEDAATGDHFIVMPLAEGSLQDRLLTRGPLAGTEAMAVLCDVLLGLSEMGPIVHGDLKPANVLFHEDCWKLADLGIARMIDEGPQEPPEHMFVSAPYAAPEQWRFESPTRATDIYGFGCLAYAVFTGEPPFPGPSQEDYCVQHLKELPGPLPAPAPVQALVQMCLNKDRAARPSLETALVLLRRAWEKTS